MSSNLSRTQDDGENLETVTKLMWTDLVGIRRARCVLGEQPVTKIGKICFAMPSMQDSVVSGTAMPQCGEYMVVPEENAQVFKVNKPHAGFETVLRLANVLEETGEPAPVCSRSMLKRAANEMVEKFGLKVELGFELEFVLSRGINNPIDKLNYAASSAIDGEPLEILLEMVRLLKSNDINVTQFHAESAHGQFEIALCHYEALEAVDKLTAAKEIVSHVAALHGLSVSFLPKFDFGQAGNSTHCHIGLVDAESGKNAFGSTTASEETHGLTRYGEAFMAGVLGHLKALLAVTVSSPNSFQRIVPGCWVGAFQIWGYQNREAPIRLVGTGGLPSTNFEYKLFDGTTNPYLGAAGIIFAGLDGISKSSILPEPCLIDPSSGTFPELPVSCSGAVEYLKSDEYLTSCFGKDLVRTIECLRKAEEDMYALKLDRLYTLY